MDQASVVTASATESRKDHALVVVITYSDSIATVFVAGLISYL